MTVGILFAGVWLLLAVPAGVFLILAYLKTRLSGFIWLCVSVVVWPLLARFLTLAANMSLPSMAASSGMPASSILGWMMVFSLGEAGVGGLLMLASCFILYRQIVRRMSQPAAATGV